MGRISKMHQILRIAEDFLVAFDDYFRDDYWVSRHTGVSAKDRTKKLQYLKKKNKIDRRLSPKDTEKTVYSLIAQSWDKKWRLVTFDISESNREFRDSIRHSLKELGFKKFQRSVWVSPLPMDPFIDDLIKKTKDFAVFSVFVGELYKSDSKKLVLKLWGVVSWYNEAEKLINEIKKQGFDDQKKQRFWDLILDHPKVPLGLLPKDWPLKDLVALFIGQNAGTPEN